MSLRIIKAGILDTIQDLGRFGYQHQGLNPGGVMDCFAASLANTLLGKELNAPVIELHFPAAQILFQKDCVLCLAGADFSPSINDETVPLYQPIFVSSNSVLCFSALKKGARCYVSLLNEMELLEPWLNSYSTNLKAGAGGFKGRKLLKGDEINYSGVSLSKTINAFLALPWSYHDEFIHDPAVEFIPGNEWNWLTEKSQIAFLNQSFLITTSSDRMGYRLQGDKLEQSVNEQLISSAVSFGTVQVLPNGQLIVLMADHQTTGGYPRIAHVTTSHLPKLAQMNAGQEITFAMTTVEEAQKELVARQQFLMQMQKTCNLKMQNWLNAHRYKL